MSNKRTLEFFKNVVCLVRYTSALFFIQCDQPLISITIEMLNLLQQNKKIFLLKSLDKLREFQQYLCSFHIVLLMKAKR